MGACLLAFLHGTQVLFRAIMLPSDPLIHIALHMCIVALVGFLAGRYLRVGPCWAAFALGLALWWARQGRDWRLLDVTELLWCFSAFVVGTSAAALIASSTQETLARRDALAALLRGY